MTREHNCDKGEEVSYTGIIECHLRLPGYTVGEEFEDNCDLLIENF